MKTLKLVLLAFGVLCSPLAFPFATLNLPDDAIFENPVNNLYVSSFMDQTTSLRTAEMIELVVPIDEDTIVVELDEVVVTAGFPRAAEPCILQQFKYPEFALKQQLEGVVAVSLVFDGEGRIHVLETCSSSFDFERYVIEKLNTLHLNNCWVKVGQTYNVRFAFKLF